MPLFKVDIDSALMCCAETVKSHQKTYDELVKIETSNFAGHKTVFGNFKNNQSKAQNLAWNKVEKDSVGKDFRRSEELNLSFARAKRFGIKEVFLTEEEMNFIGLRTLDVHNS